MFYINSTVKMQNIGGTGGEQNAIPFTAVLNNTTDDGWTADTGTLTVDTNGFSNGVTTQDCLKLVSEDATAAQITYAYGSNQNIRRGVGNYQPDLGVWVYIGDDETTATFQVQVATSAADFSHYYQTGVKSVGAGTLQKGWNQLKLWGNDWAVGAGSPRFDQVRTIRLIRSAGTGATTTKIGPITKWNMCRPKIIFRFDDAFETVYTAAYPVLAQYGFKGSICMSADNIDQAGYLTLAELNTLHEAGWDVIMHGKTHEMFPTLEAAGTLDDECDYCLNYWQTQGWTRNRENLISVYPGGQIDDASEATLRSKGYLIGLRSAYTRTWTHENVLANPFRVQCYEIDEASGAGITPANVIAAIRNLCNKGPFISLITHRIEDYTATQYQISAADFTTIVADIARGAGISWDVVTLTDYYNNLLK